MILIKENLIAFLFSASSVTLAEMGDKTQLLAMAFATRIKAYKVLIGVFIATVLNHALAVAAGTYLTKINYLQGYIQLFASLSFIIFGLWTIKGDKIDDSDIKRFKLGDVMTVAIAFFVAELGDKTQLTTIALAAKFTGVPIWILMGTTTGMLIADSIGIVLGVVMCQKIPYKSIKLISAAIFCIFGFIGTAQVLLTSFNIGVFATFIVLFTIISFTIFLSMLILKRKSSEDEIRINNSSCKVLKGYKKP